MSDMISRNPAGASQMIADALLRCAAGTCAHLRIAGADADTNQSELGLTATALSEVVISPVVMRKLQPVGKDGQAPEWELLVSAANVEKQIRALDVASAQALFAMTLTIAVAGEEYLIESVSSNEAFGQVYLYRLLLRESCRKPI